jgi:hypothetical protein
MLWKWDTLKYYMSIDGLSDGEDGINCTCNFTIFVGQNGCGELYNKFFLYLLLLFIHLLVDVFRNLNVGNKTF